MLNSETKRKIDGLRDTLVGKIPVPTEQVKQITLGLIYKFMSDLDQENKELGGKSFFAGDYARYSWQNIIDRSLSAYDRVLLYSEGLEKMVINPHIPQLFRDIFKDAFLPFRDPVTVDQFLRGINEFKYEHSEDLGDAFECLLSVMGSQGEAGQFRTPRHIIDFIVKAVGPQKTDKILDPACGTAGFLISAYKHILKQNTAPGSEHPGSALSTTERNNLSKNFIGYDISHDMVRISLVNMYLHQFSDPKIYEYDSLTSLDHWEENFDCILANPPFMTPKGGIRPHNRFAIRANRSEVLFVDYIIEHLNPSGKAGIIVPEGIIFQSANAYKALRKMLVDNGYLYAVVSLPGGVFNPYSGVKTSILLVDKILAKKTGDILFVKIENDGYDLGAQRREIDKNDLPQASKVIKRYKQALIEGKSPSSVIGDKEIEFAQLVSKSEIGKSGDFNLSGDHYKASFLFINKEWPVVELGEICEELKSGFACGESDKNSDGVPHLRPMNISSGGQLVWEDTKYISKEFFKDKKGYILKKGDILFNNTNSKELVGKTCYVDENITAGYSNHLTRIRVNKSKLEAKFLSSILHSLFEQGIFLDKCHKWVGQAGINNTVLSRIKIPLPPLKVQQEIVAELEGYQQIINGAKQVVENYKPQIKIDPKWEMVILQKVVQIDPDKKDMKSLDIALQVSFVPMADVPQKQIYFRPQQVRKLGEVIKGYTYFQNDDVLLAKITPCFENGKSGIANNLVNGIGFGSTEFIVLKPMKGKILSKWIYYFISSDEFLKTGKNYMTGTAGQQRLSIDFVSNYLIPLPSLETQKQIVEQIEEEQRLIEANKKLIEIFEQKIKDKIAEVWQ